MKITIEPDEGKEQKTFAPIIFDGVTEFSVFGRRMIQQMIPEIFRYSVVGDKHLLVGLAHAVIEDIRAHAGATNNQL